MFPSLGKCTVRKNIKKRDYQVQKSFIRFNKLMQLPFRVYSPTPMNTVQVPLPVVQDSPAVALISPPPAESVTQKTRKKEIDKLSDLFKNI